MWRIRNFLTLLTTFFIWRAVFLSSGQATVFNYRFPEMVSYILLSSILDSLVMGSRTADLSWEINSGDISILLLKPISLFKYYFSQDIADKLLNFLFLFIELSLFIVLFHPGFLVQNQPIYWLLFLVAVGLAIILFFFINFFLGLLGFWTNQVWAARFLFMMTSSLLAGSLFPLDILPGFWRFLLNLIPFSRLIYFPNQVYLAKLTVLEIFQGFGIQLLWIGFFAWLTFTFWKKGLRKYTAEGR
jgi:ABC-2 type transport system permease protein